MRRSLPRPARLLSALALAVALCACSDDAPATPPAPSADAATQRALPAGAVVGAAAKQLAAAWNVVLPAPLDMFGAMVTIPLPACGSAAAQALQRHDRLWDEFHIEVPILAHNEQLWVRISAQAYNDASDYQRLSQAVLAL